MKGKAWATATVLAVLTRLLTIEGGPLQQTRQRTSYNTIEQLNDPEREIDGAYKLLKRRSHGPSLPIGSTVTAAADVGSGQEPKYHYEVHAVHHKMGQFTSADEKLQSVIRQAAALSQHTPVITENNNIKHTTDSKVIDSQASNRKLPAMLSFSPDDVAIKTDPEKKSENQESVNEQQAENTAIHYMKQEETPNDLSPVALARQNQIPDNVPNVSGVSAASSIADVYFLAVVAGCSVAGIAGLLLAAVCWYRLHKKIKAASEVDYPAYGVTGPSAAATTTKESRSAGSPGDRKLAQSAQMYHYQHQKQQMIASERLASDNQPAGGSDVESEEENEEGDYTVFECPGLATNGEMEVRNPLFNDQTPASTPANDGNGLQQTKK
jgi:hypothetical protein